MGGRGLPRTVPMLALKVPISGTLSTLDTQRWLVTLTIRHTTAPTVMEQQHWIEARKLPVLSLTRGKSSPRDEIMTPSQVQC